MKRIHIIIVLLIILLLIITFHAQSENAGTVNSNSKNLSNEAVQNIASVYANTTGTATFNNVRVTGNIEIKGDADIKNFKGIIVMWSGLTIPSGWALCDGTNGTPDLRGRFILGSGKGTDLTERKIGDKDGSETHTLTLEEMPPHQHAYVNIFGREDGASCTKKINYLDGKVGFGEAGQVSSSDQSNQCAGTIYNNTSIIGGILDNKEKQNELTSHKAKSHNNMPPFYVLAYIMKL